MKKIKVSNEIYTDPQSAFQDTDGKWKPLRPELWQGFHWGKIPHLFGKHYSYGQPFCIFCGKKEI